MEKVQESVPFDHMVQPLVVSSYCLSIPGYTMADGVCQTQTLIFYSGEEERRGCVARNLD